MSGCSIENTSPHGSLESLRRDIDRIDDSLLELIEQRLAAATAVAAMKQAEKDDRLKLRPEREAAILARLVARSRIASPDLVALIWRTLMAYGLQEQARTALVLCAERDPGELLERARCHFGLAAELRWARSPAEAIAAAATGDAVAIVEDGLPCAIPDDRLRIFDTLRRSDGGTVGIAIGRVGDESSIAPIVDCSAAQAAASGPA